MNRSVTVFLASAVIQSMLLAGNAPEALPQAGAPAISDPTVPSPALSREIQSAAAAADSLKIRALVIGPDNANGMALVETGGASRLIRSGSIITMGDGGLARRGLVKRISSSGIEIAFSVADSEESVVIQGRFQPSPYTGALDPELVRYIECSDVPLETVMRMLSDQTGVNIVASAETLNAPVSVFLRNISAAEAVSEICRSTGLWFRHDTETGSIRITTQAEYQQNLASFREEQTETFRLLYPNVAEVAAVIYGTFPERVMLSLGEEELLKDDEYDLARRFSRFNAIADNGGSDFMTSEPPSVSSSAGGSSAGTLSFNNGRVTVLSPASAASQLSRRDEKLLNDASARGDTNEVQRLLVNAGARSASIFVTVSRKNNMLIVRTGDAKAMDDIRTLVKRLDVQTPMVLLEVKILELSLDDGFDWGIELGADRTFDKNSSNPTFTTAGYGAGLPGVTGDGLSFTLLNNDISARLRILETEGKVRSLATPMLLTANNEVSRLFIGEERPIVKNVTSQTIVTSEGNTIVVPQTEISLENIGTLLLITPSINADRTVTFRLLQENSEVAGKTAIPIYSPTTGATSDALIDVVSSRSIAGTFVAKDGLSIAVGGLIRESESVRESRVPVLGSIPLLGWLFRNKETVKTRSELIVLLKPHIIATPGEGETVSRPLLDNLSVHPARDGRDSIGILRE